MFTMRRATCLTALFLALALVSGCSEAKPPAGGSSARPLVIGAFDELSILSPVLSNNGASSMIIDLIFNGLVSIDEKMSIKPALAERWEVSADGLSWTFHLREGVTFHNGRPLSAADVMFTFDAIGDPRYINPYSHILDTIEKVTAPDELTVKMELKNPFPSLPHYLFFGILPKELYEGEDLRSTPLNFRPVGTGPYRFEGRSEDGLVLRANPSYFLGEPKIETVLVKVFDNRRAAWTGLLRGSVDYLLFLEPETAAVIDKLPRLKIYTAIHPYYHMLVFNHQNPLFKERAVRQAMNYAIDKTRIIDEMLHGAGVEVSGLAYPGSAYELSNGSRYTFEPERARKLLAQSGWKDLDSDGVLEKDGAELRFTVYLPEGGFFPEKVVILIQRQLADVGIRAEMVALPLAELSEQIVRKHKFEATLWSFASMGEPEGDHVHWASSQIGKGFNFSHFKNSRVDELLEKSRRSLDARLRMEAYADFQRAIFDDPPGIFLYWRIEKFVLPSDIKGVRVGPGGSFTSLWEWYYEEAPNGVAR